MNCAIVVWQNELIEEPRLYYSFVQDYYFLRNKLIGRWSHADYLNDRWYSDEDTYIHQENIVQLIPMEVICTT